jgi:hypothetical protein
MGVSQFEEGGRWWWCGFNALILAREERQHDETLLEDEAEATSSYLLYGKES